MCKEGKKKIKEIEEQKGKIGRSKGKQRRTKLTGDGGWLGKENRGKLKIVRCR